MPRAAVAPAGEAALAEAFETISPPGALILLFERDSAPAQIRRAAERAGLAITCPRPFDNQLPQFAEAFARAEGLRLGRGVADLLVSRHAGDLAAIANVLAKAAIHRDPGATLGPADLSEPAAATIPDLFDLSEAVAAGKAAAALMILERALGAGRDPLELLSVEVVPVMRRMMAAGSMMLQRKSTLEIAAALGLSPASPLAVRAIEGARRLGPVRLEQAYRRVSELDAQFKNGRVKERGEALAAMLLDLLGTSSEA
jgi:DNA polymerase III subunit delta